jgi:hypothetical protein
MNDIPTTFLELATAMFHKQKSLAERAMAQLPDRQLFESIDSEANSIAVIVKHLHGNMRSRWTDFLTTDGEKPDRQRDGEFIMPPQLSRATVMQWWEEGWGFVFAAMGGLSSQDVGATVRVRGEEMPVMAAILRQIDHYAQHVGQIVLLAKHARGEEWKSLSIPRGKSEEFMRQFMERRA